MSARTLIIRLVLLGGLTWLATDVPTPVAIAADKLAAGTHPGELWEGNELHLKLRWCPPGTFWMGSPKAEKDRYRNEDQVPVTIRRGFWLGQHEVTQREWKAVMGTTLVEQQAQAGWRKLYGKGDDFPLYYVNHDEATEFCVKLTDLERRTGRLPVDWEFRLPTEAQWEYGSRAGSKGAFSFGDDASDLGEYAWFGSNSDWKTHVVGTKKPNMWGWHDMLGNVWEWCCDWYDAKLLGGTDPERTQLATIRVLRGGCWFNAPWGCRSAFRIHRAPDFQDYGLGFRVTAAQSGK